MEENSFTLEELQKLLDNYFYSKEEKEIKINSFLESKEKNDNRINDFLNKYEEEKNINSEKSEVIDSFNAEMHNEIIKEIKTLQEYSQFNNNLTYFNIIVVGLMLAYVLFYKFLRNFI